MRLTYYTLSTLIALFISCTSSEYTEEEKAKLEEAQKIHNEAMATFAESKMLLSELTEVRAELRRRSGLEIGGGNAQQSLSEDTISQNTQTENARQDNMAKNSDTSKVASNSKANDSGNSTSGGLTRSADTTTVSNNIQDALDKLNKAQNELLSWMRNIHAVPGLNEKKEGEKTKDPALGMDFDSRRLTKDLEFKEYPEGTGINEIYEEQKEMKKKIDKINEDLKKAIEEGKSAYMSI